MNINLQKQELFNLIDNNTNLSIILDKYNEFILNVMNTYITNFPLSKKQELASYMIDYIKAAIQNDYINRDIIKRCLKDIIETSKKIRSKDFNNSDELDEYGHCFYQMEFMFDLNQSSDILKHTVFHEMTHSISKINNDDLGIKSDKTINILSRSTNQIDSSKIGNYDKRITIKPKEESQYKIKINGINNSVVHIISPDFKTFLEEVMAESTACDLLNDYKNNKVTSFYGFESDWVTKYNQDYQKLGYEFLKTLNISGNEREVFKTFTKNSIYNDGYIFTDILNIYESSLRTDWIDDLHNITVPLGNIVNRNFNSDRIKQSEDLMKKYTKITINGINIR